MSVKIEVLEYQYGEYTPTQQADQNLASWSNTSLASGWANMTGTTSAAGSNGGLNFNASSGGSISQGSRNFLTLTHGQTYQFSFNVESINTSGGNCDFEVRGNNISGGGTNVILTQVSGYLGVTSYQFSFTMDITQNNNSGDVYLWFRMYNSGGSTLPANIDLEISDFTMVNVNTLGIVNSPLVNVDQENSIYGELDVSDHTDFPLALTFQLTDIQDITSTSGNYSKSFKIPATKNNNKLLKQPFISNIKKEVDAYDNLPCRIMINNLFSLKGTIKVTGVGGVDQTPSYYECVFYGNNLTWASEMSEKHLNEIYWGSSGENLELKNAPIRATWLDEDCTSSDSPIVYPVVSYGNYNPDGTVATVQLLENAYERLGISSSQTGYYGWFDQAGNTWGDSYGTPVPTTDWRPAIYVKDTLDKIFAQAGVGNSGGYTIVSEFMETDMFKKLVWLLPNFKYNNRDQREIDFSFGSSFTGEGFIKAYPTTTSSTSYTWPANQVDPNDAGADFVINDYFDNVGWDAAGEFTAQEFGKYRVSGSEFAVYWESSTTPTANDTHEVAGLWIEVQVQTVGQTSWNNTGAMSSDLTDADPLIISASSDQNGVVNFNSVDNIIWLNKGDKVRLIFKRQIRNQNASTTLGATYYLFGSNSPTSTSASDAANGKYSIKFLSELVEYGQTYNLSDVIDDSYKQIDFVKGIAHAFNLRMTTDEETKQIYIEPFDSFYKPFSQARDWTQKLDRSKEIKDKKLGSDLKRELVFKYKSDNSDEKVAARGEEYFHGIQDEYPYQKFLPNSFPKGKTVFENPFFAGTYNAPDSGDTMGPNANYSDVNTAPSACLWEEDVSAGTWMRPEKGNDFLPRLLSWNKYSAAGTWTVFNNRIVYLQIWADTHSVLWPMQSSLSNYGLVIPQAVSYNQQNTSMPNLCYDNMWARNFDDSTQTFDDAVIQKGLYDTYYSKLIRTLRDNPIMRTCYIDLKVLDIINLNLDELVYIDGAYWRIQRVVDYKPNSNTPTKVELIQWIERGAFAASAPPFSVDPTDPTDNDIPDDYIPQL
tara:strand:+ start:5309 stop:8443 length:3135 start_codon:yes stop_codon:yes gene_type:complete